jgi:Tfp pilus assembly protein PilO
MAIEVTSPVKKQGEGDTGDGVANQAELPPENQGAAQAGNSVEMVEGANQGEEQENQSPDQVEAKKTGINIDTTAIKAVLETPKGQTFTTGIATALVVAILFFFAITPALSSITRQLEVNEALRERITAQEAKRETLNSLASKETNLAQSYQTFSDLFGEQRHQSAIYRELTDIAEDNNLEFRSLSFELERPNVNKYEDLPTSNRLRYQTINFTVNGSFSNVDQLVEELESSQRVYDILSVTITAEEQSTNSGVIDINMNTFYWEFNQ